MSRESINVVSGGHLVCPACGGVFDRYEGFCPICGAPISAEQVKIIRGGKAIQPSSASGLLRRLCNSAASKLHRRLGGLIGPLEGPSEKRPPTIG
jgi:hypothetical protein